MKQNKIIARNKKGESAQDALARVQSDWPDKQVEFEDPDTPPMAKESNDEASGSKWTEDYARKRTQGTLRYTPESPSARGERGLNRIWGKLLPQLQERGVFPAPSELPKDVSKWAVLPDWVELLDKHPHVHRNVFDWLDSWVPKDGHVFRNGAATVRRVKGHEVARTKQYGQGFNDPTPSFTFHGERLPYQDVRKMLEKEMRALRSEYPDKYTYDLDVESMEDWDKVLGGRCSTYVFCESSILYHGMTPQQETDSPIPWDIFASEFQKSLDFNFPGYGPGKSTLQPAEMFVGTSSSGGITLGNADGSAGYPYTNMDQDAIRKAFERPKFKGRATKGVAFQHALRDLTKWIEAGMPMKGKLYERVAQPATLAYRGDRAVHLGIRALASRGQDQTQHDTANRLAAMLPSRSIIIVSTALVLAQSLWAQPLGNHIAGAASPGFDWVDPGHTVKRLDEIRKRDLQPGADEGVIATVGADASGWDRDVCGQFIAGDTAWYMSMFPQEAEVLYVDSVLPIDVDAQWISNTRAELSAGGEGSYRVTAILSDGSETTTEVTAKILRFDMWEYITKVMSMINDSPIRWADYEIDAQGMEYDLGRINPTFKGYYVYSNGGRKTGDAATGIGNSWSNDVVTGCAAAMSRMPELADLVRRRATLQETPVSGGYTVVDKLHRGDDLALVIKLDKKGTVPSEAVACGICSIGMRANAKKQEASDVPGVPVFGFANVLVTEKYMGKMLGRTAQRYMVQESRGLSLEMLNALRAVGNDTGISDAIVATTATAKARLAPMAGFPLMDEHPLTPFIVEWAVHNDEYRLAYLSDGSFDENGQVTEEARELLQKAAQVEARAQAKLRARRENVNVDLEALKEAYVGSTIHDHVTDYALVDNYRPSRLMPRVDNHALFKNAVRTDSPLELLD